MNYETLLNKPAKIIAFL